MTPNNAGPSVANIVGDFLPPNDKQPILRRFGAGEFYASSTAVPTDWELGGIAVNDSSQGMQYQTWKFELISSQVFATASRTKTTSHLHTIEGVEPDEITGCFDGNMRPIVAYPLDGAISLYHYDGSIPAFVITRIEGYSPRLTFDDARSLEVNMDNADVMLFYLRDGSCWYRQSRDRFQQERFWCQIPLLHDRIGRVGRTVVNRMQVELLCTG